MEVDTHDIILHYILGLSMQSQQRKLHYLCEQWYCIAQDAFTDIFGVMFIASLLSDGSVTFRDHCKSVFVT